MTPDELRAAIVDEAEALAAAARGHMDAEVPSCPGWTVETLLNHLGRVHQWTRELVSAGGDAPTGFPPRPDAVTEEWFLDGVTQLCATLEEAGAEAPAWTFLGPGAARFWFRRQAVETAVHRWDVELAAGRPPAPIGTDLALVGVDEILDMHLPRRLASDDAPSLPVASLHIHATDTPHGEWVVRSSDGELLVGHGHERGDAAVRATAGDLLLWLWGRRSLDDVEVLGSRGAAEAWAGLLAD